MHPPVRKTSDTPRTTYSPSFTSYFNTDLKQIAVRVTSEFADIDEDAFLIRCLEPDTGASTSHTNTQITNRSCLDEELDNTISSKEIVNGEATNNNNNEEEILSEFEFDLANLLPPNGDLGPVYPVFNRDVLFGSFNSPPKSADETSKVEIQLKKLFLDEHRDDPCQTAAAGSSSSSSSDSEVEELDSFPPGTYTAWTPNKLPSQSSTSPSCCLKSNSTGSTSAASSSTAAGKAKEFRLRDLLRRSKSDGKDGVMLITPMSKQKRATALSGTSGVAKGHVVVPSGVRGSPARESCEYHYYRRGREGESGNARRKSYLPYKQDLVGFFVTS